LVPFCFGIMFGDFYSRVFGSSEFFVWWTNHNSLGNLASSFSNDVLWWPQQRSRQERFAGTHDIYWLFAIFGCIKCPIYHCGLGFGLVFTLQGGPRVDAWSALVLWILLAYRCAFGRWLGGISGHYHYRSTLGRFEQGIRFYRLEIIFPLIGLGILLICFGWFGLWRKYVWRLPGRCSLNYLKILSYLRLGRVGRSGYPNYFRDGYVKSFCIDGT